VKLFVLFVDGFDLRRVGASVTPFINGLLESSPHVKITGFMGTDHLPTMLTGAYPVAHGFWGVRIKPETRRSIANRLVDTLPDFVTTTAQCLAHAITGSVPLAAVPPSRRRRLQPLRTQQLAAYRDTKGVLELGGLPTCFGAVGESRSRYRYSRTTDLVGNLVSGSASGRYDLEMLRVYSLDLVQRWDLDRGEFTASFYGRIDDLAAALHAECQKQGVTMIVMSDHGYDVTSHIIDLPAKLAALRLPRSSYTCFIELSMARFWFHTDEARAEITRVLEGLDGARHLRLDDLQQYHLDFPDDRHGEAFLVTEPGWMLFPHDFHQPLANLYLGIRDQKQRGRLRSPLHRGEHTLLPEYESARGFLILPNAAYEAETDEISLVDVAPSLLALGGFEVPSTMVGHAAFRPL